MKRWLKCWSVFFAFIFIIFIFASCSNQVTDENGITRDTVYDYFPVIESDWEYSRYVVYDPVSKIVYHMAGGHGGYMTPYMLYEDGVIYGAIFEDGKIVPAPFAIQTPTE